MDDVEAGFGDRVLSISVSSETRLDIGRHMYEMDVIESPEPLLPLPSVKRSVDEPVCATGRNPSVQLYVRALRELVRTESLEFVTPRFESILEPLSERGLPSGWWSTEHDVHSGRW